MISKCYSIVAKDWDWLFVLCWGVNLYKFPHKLGEGLTKSLRCDFARGNFSYPDLRDAC